MGKDKNKEPEATDKGGATYMTARLYAADGEALNDIARMEGLTLASVFNKYFGEQVVKIAQGHFERRLKELKNPK